MILVLLAAGCSRQAPLIMDSPYGTTCDAVTVKAERTAMPTVVRVSWTTDEPTDQVVWYSGGDGPERATEVSSGTDHEVLLTGLRPLTEVSFHVGAPDGSGCATPSTVTTGSFAASLPDVRATVAATDEAEGGFTIVPAIGTDEQWVIAVDDAGEVVWAWSIPPENGPPPQALRARLSVDGKSIVYNVNGVSEEKGGRIARVSLDGETFVETDVSGGHTDFVERAPGEYAVLGWDVQEIDDGRKLLGDTVMEVDESGASEVVWDAFDWLDVHYAASYETGWYVPDPDVEDWSHVNGIDYDADADGYTLSVGGLSGVAHVDRATGVMDWYLSDQGGDFAGPGGERLVQFPHSAQWLGDAVLVFNRGDIVTADGCSAADEIALDPESGTAARTWHYGSEACLLVPFLGDAERLTGGNTLVAWTTAGQIDEVTPDGELAYRLNVPIGTAFGFASRVDRLGPPAE